MQVSWDSRSGLQRAGLQGTGRALGLLHGVLSGGRWGLSSSLLACVPSVSSSPSRPRRPAPGHPSAPGCFRQLCPAKLHFVLEVLEVGRDDLAPAIDGACGVEMCLACCSLSIAENGKNRKIQTGRGPEEEAAQIHHRIQALRKKELNIYNSKTNVRKHIQNQYLGLRSPKGAAKRNLECNFPRIKLFP